jgi:hypothetical protein
MTHNLNVQFINGFRYIERTDIEKPFRTDFTPMDEFSLKDYFVWNYDSETMAIVKEVESDIETVIASVALITIHE